jgi:hypothetical protein
MKPTHISFTRHAEDMLAERNIERAWVELTVASPESVQADPKGPGVYRAYRRIPEHGGRFLRVVYTLAGEHIRIVTAFFDRQHKA